MSTVPEIVNAAAALDPDQFVVLREELDRLEKRLWEGELARTTAEMDTAGLTDDDIDRMVLRRRNHHA